MVIQAGFLDSHLSREQFSTQGKFVAHASVEIPLPYALYDQTGPSLIGTIKC